MSGDAGSRYRFGPRQRGRAGRVAGGPDHHGRGRPRVRRPRAAVGAQCGGRGGGHRRARPLRRRGDGTGVGADRRRVAAGRGVLGHPPGRNARHAADRCAARRTVAARLPTGTTWAWCTTARRTRLPRRSRCAGRSFALLGADEAGPPRGGVGLRPLVAGPRGLAGAPGAVGRRGPSPTTARACGPISLPRRCPTRRRRAPRPTTRC